MSRAPVDPPAMCQCTAGLFPAYELAMKQSIGAPVVGPRCGATACVPDLAVKPIEVTIEVDACAVADALIQARFFKR